MWFIVVTGRICILLILATIMVLFVILLSTYLSECIKWYASFYPQHCYIYYKMVFCTLLFERIFDLLINVCAVILILLLNTINELCFVHDEDPINYACMICCTTFFPSNIFYQLVVWSILPYSRLELFYFPLIIYCQLTPCKWHCWSCIIFNIWYQR